MKKIFFTLLIILLLVHNCIYVNALSYDEKILYESTHSKFISRNDAITYVVYACGIDIHWASDPFGSTTPMFCDYFHIESYNDNDIFRNFLNNTNLQFLWQGDQVASAVYHMGLCFGYGDCEKHSNGFRIQPLKAATVAESLAFMVRALVTHSNELYDLNYIVEVAKEKGLIIETDSFYDNLQKPITFDEFRVILGRFMNQKVGLGGSSAIYTPDAEAFFWRYNDIDITYYELLEEEYGTGYPERILDLKGYEWLESFFDN